MTAAVSLPIYPDTSMSSNDLLLSCQAWAVGAVPVEEDITGPPGRFGNGIHLLLQWYLEKNGPVAPDVAASVENVLPKDLPRFHRVWNNLRAWLERQDTAGWLPEIAFALDPVAGTARELGRAIKREYDLHGRLPHELPGTGDIVFIEPARVTVLDLKTGRSPPERYRMQLLGLGLAAARTFNRPAARVGILKADEACVDVVDAFEAGPEELAWTQESLRAAWVNASPEPRGGDHCKTLWCKARKRCRGAV